MTQQTGFCGGGRAQAHIADTTDRGHLTASDGKSGSLEMCSVCVNIITLERQSVAYV